MPLTVDLTVPEHGCDRSQRQAIAERVKACGGCALCLERDRKVIGWGRSVCRKDGRSFPQCATDNKTPAFALDEQQLKDFR